MNRILEALTLWVLSLSYWFIKGRGAEKAETVAVISAANLAFNSYEPLQNEYSKDDSIISAGLSELMQRRKIRTNQGRRKEDKKYSKN